MSIVDDLVENLVERNTVKLNGTLTISLIDGGLTVKGKLFSTLRDQKKEGICSTWRSRSTRRSGLVKW